MTILEVKKKAVFSERYTPPYEWWLKFWESPRAKPHENPHSVPQQSAGATEYSRSNHSSQDLQQSQQWI